ncbi:MAG: hypothetical protein KAR18_01890, partial [Spirochaetes bacterium]|nr:hypothetical protein [Spirochaetota bacterium]
KELVSILINNFNRHETLRQELWNKVPKYGNDDDFADTIAREIGQYYCREVGRYDGSFGIKFRPGLFAVSINVPFGLTTGATAEGRKSGQPLADGGISPAAGSEKEGILGVIRSAAKIDNVLATNGTLLNVRLNPSIFEKDEDISKLVDLLRSYNDLNGYHIQFNVTDSEILRKAQKDPDEYRGIMIRVAGYSAYFVELNPEVQEDIISRSIHAEI